MLNIQVNYAGFNRLAEFLGVLDQRVVEELSRRNAEVIAPALEETGRQVMKDEIYAVAVPRNAKGRSRWTRTGDLLFRERAFADGLRIVLLNSSEHAAPRAALGQSNPPNHAGRRAGVQSGLSPTKPVDWHAETMKRKRSWIAREYQDAIRVAMQVNR